MMWGGSVMQTVAVQIQDDFMQNFLNFINNHQESITITKDPYFYERQKELQEIRDDIKSGKAKLISFGDFENKVSKFEKNLELKYAN